MWFREVFQPFDSFILLVNRATPLCVVLLHLMLAPCGAPICVYPVTSGKYSSKQEWDSFYREVKCKLQSGCSVRCYLRIIYLDYSLKFIKRSQP